ncbi:hypothetical protein [Dyella sp. GSA-30]|uniref:hypothetical protein n=1 Tax=Dyella sp. GSA-30 TaxID=2994496 RepID=UPI002492727B|nr:hypothetical protein [Dyella sp. GSA-30]BDU18761.1 hypothetical protein DYGSA30_02180 [Dyella sp. GSA-30]
MSHVLRRVFTLAEQLEPNRAVIWDWLWHTPIQTLGGRTAIELAFAGHGDSVVAMLEAALLDQTEPSRPYLLHGGRTARHLEPVPPGSI